MVSQAWKNKAFKLFFIVVSILITQLLFTGQLYSYSKGVHEKITEKVIDQNITKIDDYLKNIGLNKGVDENLKNSFSRKKVREWIEHGSWFEDIDPGILFSHYLNPLTNKGYTELGIEIGQSAYDSANDLDNSGAWVWARKRLYDGLTETDNTNREKYLSIALHSLGRAMHLVQDMAVPAHTRNDFHPPESYEKYTSINVEYLPYTAVPFPYWNVSISQGAPKQIWDFDTYDGSIAYSSGYIGLSEYTNANFFSEDTIFIDFPHPAKENTTAHLVQQYAKDGQLDKVWYIQGYTSQKALAAYSYFNKWLSSDKWEYNLDDSVYEDYASQLIPRAVGYSAGLLDYFFRGKIEPVFPEEVKDASNEITKIRMYIRNNTPSESLEPLISPDESKFVVSYEYTDPNDDNKLKYGASDELPLNATINSGSESSDEYTFTFNPPIPSHAQFIRYWLVYRGKLGNENDAVIGKVFSNYLFITSPGQHVYSITDGSQMPYLDSYGNLHQQFTNMKAKIQILTLYDQIESGNIQAVARYKILTDYQADLSSDPPDAGDREPDFSYSASQIQLLSPEDITALNNLELREFTFDFTNDPIPAGITDLYLDITINGILVGDTVETAIATGNKDLMEPAHHVFWNLTDMFSLDNHLYISDVIKNTPALAAQVDFDGDGIFNEVSEGEPYIDPRYNTTIEISYNSTLPPLYPSATVVLPAGRFIRLIVLVDSPDNNYVRFAWDDPDVPDTAYYDDTFEGVINQEIDGTWQESPTTNTFRYGLDIDEITEIDIRQHYYNGIIGCYPMAGPISCSYPEEEAIPAELAPYPVTILLPSMPMMAGQSIIQSISDAATDTYHTLSPIRTNKNY